MQRLKDNAKCELPSYERTSVDISVPFLEGRTSYNSVYNLKYKTIFEK